jgi:hypothetical protein
MGAELGDEVRVEGIEGLALAAAMERYPDEFTRLQVEGLGFRIERFGFGVWTRISSRACKFRV